jgi:hypothetical protein
VLVRLRRKASAPATINVALPDLIAVSILGIHLALRRSSNRHQTVGASFISPVCLPFEATSAAASRQTARRMHPLAAMLAVILDRRGINTSPVLPD